jgi:hypothetical protein
MADIMLQRVARAICAERNSDDCRLGCTQDTGCLQNKFTRADDEFGYARWGVGAMSEPSPAVLAIVDTDTWRALVDAILKEGLADAQ